MRCDELMTAEAEVVRTRQTAREAAARMRDLNIGFLPVVDDAQQLAGVLTDRDLALRVVAEGRPHEVSVSEIMTEEVITCAPQDEVERAEDLMRTFQKSRLVVVDDDGRVAGVLSLADLAQYEDETRAGQVVADITEREVEAH